MLESFTFVIAIIFADGRALVPGTRTRSISVPGVGVPLLLVMGRDGRLVSHGLDTRSWGGCAAVSVILMGRDGRLVSHGLDTLF